MNFRIFIIYYIRLSGEQHGTSQVRLNLIQIYLF